MPLGSGWLFLLFPKPRGWIVLDFILKIEECKAKLEKFRPNWQFTRANSVNDFHEDKGDPVISR